MTKKIDKEEIRSLIEKEITSTKSKLEDLKELTKPIAPENSIGRISRMDAINNKSINDAALANAKQKIGKLEEALRKLDTNDFGLCAKCKQQIPVGRILLMPQSPFCVNCA